MSEKEEQQEQEQRIVKYRKKAGKKEAEANAGILGIKSTTAKQRIYGSFDPYDLINNAHQTRNIIQYDLDLQAGMDNRLANQNYLLNSNARISGVNQDIESRQLPTAPPHSIEGSQEQMMRYYPLAEQTDFAPSVTITEVESEIYRDRQVEGQQLNINIQEMNKNMQYLGGLDWGLDPVNIYYERTPHISKPIDYYLQDSALSVRQRKQYLSKKEQLNKPKSKINYIKADEMVKQVEAQGKLKKQTGRKKKSSTTRKSKKH
ncbi:MAG: hypothetical protein EZS28_038654 [Streblomastix strix]|uniref:Uncharacterized protein n=1 Tax=Streblomastix strix TaxID=222440 RepID=A0A5J4U666_9EUKA|nr:MAG: hypothetical protein EZS28_038654 [Streblomastix strix]